MKNYTQVYVKDSLEAADFYCKAFGAEITFEIKNPDKTEYEHCELSVDGEGFLALSEAQNPCDVAFIHEKKWETMTFNVFEMGSEERVDQAFRVLSDGGVVLQPIQALPWNPYSATVIDKYGVCWWIAI
ncbi:VOC family protein [Acutalibacter caecimuris]|uniref:VOC family protein n=1 Tax=Acutalibacter caecimuris TaxID=3093657 RepID=UPI002AC8F741|nr:VOC family protein [Acutalibacter sp. M00118]